RIVYCVKPAGGRVRPVYLPDLGVSQACHTGGARAVRSRRSGSFREGGVRSGLYHSPTLRSSMPVIADEELRAAALSTIQQYRESYGGRIPRAVLMSGVVLHGMRIPIWNYQ